MDPVTLTVVGLALLLTAFVGYGLAFLSRSVAGGQFGWLSGFLAITIGPIGWVAEQVVGLTKWLTHAIGSHFEQVEGTAVAWITALTGVSDYTWKSLAGIAYDLHDFSRWLVLKEIPALVKALPNAVTHVVHAITTRIVHVERTIVKLPGLTKAQIRAAVAVAIPGIIAHDLPYFDWLKKHLKSLERILAGAAGAAIGSVLGLPKDLIGIRKRIGKLEKTLAGTAVAGAVALALARLGVSWIRCNNWKRLGRGVCGLPSNVISDILGLITDVFILADICEVIKLTDDAFGVIEGPLASFVGNVGGALCHGDFPEQAWGGIGYSTAAPELNALAL